MTEHNYWTRRRPISRRSLLRGAAGGSIGLAGWALIGCSGDDDDSTSTATPGGGTGTPAATPTESGGGGTATATPEGSSMTPVDGGAARGVFLGGNVFDSVDVHRAFGDPTSWLSNYVLNKVVRYSNPDTGEIEGDLAETWEAPDASTYTFNIRKDVYWQDTPLTGGRQLTAEDIKWHWERQAAGMLADGTVTDFRHQTFYETIANIEVPDDFTITATLNEPNGTFLGRLAAYFSTVPNREATEAFEADHRTLTEDAMPATGAYTLKQWRSDEEIIFIKNPLNFRQGEPHLDGWIYPLLFEDPNARRVAFEQKQIDAFGSPDPSLTKSIIEANPDDMWEVLTGVANTVFMHLNMNRQFTDVRHVRALNAAFDRRGMIQTFHQGLGQVSGPVTWLQEGYALEPDELITYDGYRTNRDEDIKVARDLWDAADGASLGDINIQIPDTWLGPWPDTTQVIPAMLNEALGVDQFQSTRTTYNEEIIPNLANGEFPNWFAWTSQVSSPDPRAELRQTFHSTSTANFEHVDNPDLDALLDQALVSVDYEEGVELIRDAQRLILENGQYGNVVLYNYISRSAGWNYFHGNNKVAPAPPEPGQGYNIFAGHLASKNVWVDPNDPSFQGRATITL
jgi:peptide/nickel transport system substrate-binding protein